MKAKRNLLVFMALAFLFTLMPTQAALAAAVCQIGMDPYDTLGAALEDVPSPDTSPTTIKLLDDITYSSECTINNKKITFDLNGNDLRFTNGLCVHNSAIINYTGFGSFEAACVTDTPGDELDIAALHVDDNSSCELTGVEAVDNGSGSGRYFFGVLCENNSTVVVNGEVVVRGSAEIGSCSTGIRAEGAGASVTVNGNVRAASANFVYGIATEGIVTVNGNVRASGTAERIGVYAYRGGTATVNGTLTAQLYVCLWSAAPGMRKTITDFSKSAARPGYYTYSDGTSSVRVKIAKVTSKLTVAKGKKVAIKGKLTPVRSKTKVKLVVQRRVGKKWQKVETFNVKVKLFSGAYGLKWKPTKKGTYRVRATVAKAEPCSKAASKWMQFKRK